MGKITKALLAIAGAAVIAGAGYVAGSETEEWKQIKEQERREDVAAIAVVNMDNGVLRKETQVNYASQLMVFPDADFVSAGFFDARAGIRNGSYAAYIIIPENFSVSVASIENNPQKITLEYAYNPNLNEEAKIRAVQRVHNFQSSLNANISYMYIDAVLSAFHEIQDDSGEILHNDAKELKLLQSVDAARLIAEMEHPDINLEEADIPPVELASYTQQNQTSLMGMSEDYAAVLQKGREAYLEIQGTGTEVSEATTDFFTLYQMILAETAQTQAELLQKGQADLREDLGRYNKDIVSGRAAIEEQIAEMARKQMETDQYAVHQQLKEILTDIDNVKLQSKWENAYRGIQGYVNRTVNKQVGELTENYKNFFMDRVKRVAHNSYLQGVTDTLAAAESPDFDKEAYQKRLGRMPEEDFVTVSGNDLYITVSGNDIIFGSSEGEMLLPDDTKDPVSIDWDNPTDMEGKPIEIPERDMAGAEDYAITLTTDRESNERAVAEAAAQTAERLSLEENETILQGILKNAIADPILNESLTQLEKMKDAYSGLSQKMLSYEDRVLTFDPVVYLEQADLNLYLNEITGNTENMMGAVAANNAEYAAYAADTYRTAVHNMATLRTALNDAQMQTASNVEASIESLIASRKDTNAQNASMLENFTGLLAYTRVQSQGNPEVYDYIVNPVMAADHSAMSGKTTAYGEKAPQQKSVLFGKFILWMAIGVCIVIVTAGICRKYFRWQKEDAAQESEEVL